MVEIERNAEGHEPQQVLEQRAQANKERDWQILQDLCYAKINFLPVENYRALLDHKGALSVCRVPSLKQIAKWS